MGKPVATEGSQHICPVCKAPGIIVKGESNALVNGKPIATIQSTCNCGAQIVTGTANVLINGKPIATVGDLTSHGSTIISGSPNVIISSGSSKPTAITPIKKIRFHKIRFIDKIINSKGIKEFEEKKKIIKKLAEGIYGYEEEVNRDAEIDEVIFLYKNDKGNDEDIIKSGKDFFYGQELKIRITIKNAKNKIIKFNLAGITPSNNQPFKTINSENSKYWWEMEVKDQVETKYFTLPTKWYSDDFEKYDKRSYTTKILKSKLNKFYVEVDFNNIKPLPSVRYGKGLKPITYKRNYEELLGLTKTDSSASIEDYDLRDNYENDFINNRITSNNSPILISSIVNEFSKWLFNNPKATIGDIDKQVAISARMLWRCATLQNRGGKIFTEEEGKITKKIVEKPQDVDVILDDRPLYWARIKMQVILKRQYVFIEDIKTLAQPEQDKFFIESIVPEKSQLHKTIVLFEEKSRNYIDIDFSNAKSGQKKLLMIGFDPFSLKSNILQSNPSGVSVLNLHSQNIGGYHIQTFIVPVRYKDFDEFKDGKGVIEKYVTDFIKNKEVDMIITVSQTTPFRFNIDRFAGKNRGGKNDNMNWSKGGNNTYFNQIKLNGEEFYQTTLPYQKIVPNNNYNSLFPIFFNQTYETNSHIHDDEDVEGPEKIENLLVNFNGLSELRSQGSVKGSGSSYLSNESFYRVARLRDFFDKKLKTGHYHIPLIQASKNVKEYYDVTLKYRNASKIEIKLNNSYIKDIVQIIKNLIKKSNL